MIRPLLTMTTVFLTAATFSATAFAQAAPVAAAPAADISKTLAALNAKFALASKTTTPQLHFLAGEGGLACADVNTSAGTGRIYLLGGHVTAWQPAGQEPVIFVSSATPYVVGKAIRGGVPVCFPWFAGKAEGAVAGVGGTAGPLHGTVRIIEWQVEETRDLGDGAVAITLLARSDAASKQVWPGDYEVRERVTFGKELQMELQVKNTGTEPMKYEEAFHPYFYTKDARKVSVLGLEGVDYIDKVDGRKVKKQEGAVMFPGETDRIYLNTKGPVTIVDESLGRRIKVEKADSMDTVIWSPGATKAVGDLGAGQGINYVTIESANVIVNAPTVRPGETKSFGFRASVSK